MSSSTNIVSAETERSVIVVGAGVFGLSTAYYLSIRGYKSVTVLDRHPVPSREAASSDVSKIIRSDYADPLYARMGLEAVQAWQSWDMFKDLYSVPGWILSAQTSSVPFVAKSIDVSKTLGVQGIEQLTTEEIRGKFPVITGPLDGYNINVWNPSAGWVHASSAMMRMKQAAEVHGVRFVSGEAGHVHHLLVNKSGDCKGVATHDGSSRSADLVVVATGAWTPSFVDMEGQLTAKGHAVAHIQLTPEETEHYQSLPIIDNLELGYFFPPLNNGVFKMAHSQFVTNHVGSTRSSIRTSVPHTFVEHPRDDLPVEIAQTMRRNLARVLPELADRPFCYTRLCWDADTVDRHFLIAPHPSHHGLFLACGGSAHGFKFLPVLGSYVVDALEGRLDPNTAHQWRWRPGFEHQADDLAHMDPDLELRSLTGWRNARKASRM